MGRSPPWSRSQVVGTWGRRPASCPASPPGPAPCARDVAGPARSSVVACQPDLRRTPTRLGDGFTWRVPNPAVLGPARSSSPHRRGRGPPRALPRAPGPRHSAGQGGEPVPQPPRACLGRPLSRAGAQNAPRSAERAGVRAPELEETHSGHPWSGSVLFRSVVQWMEKDGPGGGSEITRGRCAYLARRRRLAATRADRRECGACSLASSKARQRKGRRGHLAWSAVVAVLAGWRGRGLCLRFGSAPGGVQSPRPSGRRRLTGAATSPPPPHDPSGGAARAACAAGALGRHHFRHPQFADVDQTLRWGGVSRPRVAEAGDGVAAPVRRRRLARAR